MSGMAGSSVTAKGFGKNQPALVAVVNGALAAMQRDGSINQLKEKWGVP